MRKNKHFLAVKKILKRKLPDRPVLYRGMCMAELKSFRKRHDRWLNNTARSILREIQRVNTLGEKPNGDPD